MLCPRVPLEEAGGGGNVPNPQPSSLAAAQQRPLLCEPQVLDRCLVPQQVGASWGALDEVPELDLPVLPSADEELGAEAAASQGSHAALMPPQRLLQLPAPEVPHPHRAVGTAACQHRRIAVVEEDAADGPLVSHQGRQQHGTLLKVPQTHCHVRAAAREHAGGVRAEGDIEDVVCVSSEPGAAGLAGVEVPDLDGGVRAAGRYPAGLLVAESDAEDLPRVRLLRLLLRSFLVHHPDLDSLVA
eukprot:756141-Hanusia_phi.AAC.9